MCLIDIMAKRLRLAMYLVYRFSYVLRNRIPLVCREYVEECSFVWSVSRLCRYTIGYVIGVFETQVVTFVVVVPDDA